MNINKLIKRVLLLVSIIVSFNVIAADIHPITHPSIGDIQLSKLELRRIFSKRVTQWPNGQPIVVFVLESSHPFHQRFSTETLKIFPYQLDRIWQKITFSGIGTAPTVVKDYQELLNKISNTPGAIGYGEHIAQGGGLHVINVTD